MPGIGSVVIQFKAKSDQARKEIGRISGALNKFGRSSVSASGALSKLKKVGVGVAAGVAGGLTVGAAAAWNFAQAAIEDEVSAERLAGALKKAAKATSAQVDATEDWISAQGIAKGFADDKLRPALVRLVRATGDVREAQKLTALAMDISTETGKDLTTVAEGLAKAHDGNINALKRMGITLGEEAQNSIEYAKEVKKLNDLQADAALRYRENGAASAEYKAAAARVAEQQRVVNAVARKGVDWQDELGRAYKGAAKRAAQTTKGTWDRVKLIFSEIGESIGGFAIPMLGSFADWFAQKKNKKNVQEWIDKIGEWSTSIGTEFAGKIQDFIAYLQSPEGKAAMADFSDRLQTIATNVQSIVGAVDQVLQAFDRLKSAYDSLPGAVKEAAKWAVPSIKWAEAVSSPQKMRTKSEPGASSKTGGAYANSSGVTVNIYNPKAEKASTSIAAAHRSAKYMDKRTGGLA